jgi:glycerophosphoryl diester phosphodiesterase
MCQEVLRLDPSAHVQYLNGDINPAKLKADGMAGLDYHFSVFKKHPEWVQEAKDNKLVLNAWTVNDREEMRSLLDQGFDFITTNEPELLFELAGSSTAVKK